MGFQSGSPLPYSEEWWRVTLSSIGDAVIVTDRVAKVVFMNPVAESLTGWTNDEANGTPLDHIFQIINETSRAVLENPAIRVLKTGIAALSGNSVLISRSGADITIADSAAPIRDSEGNVFGVVLVFRDATKEKQAHTAQAYLASIIESSDDAIVAKTLQGVITSWNKAAERMFGYSAVEAIGKQVYLIIPPERHSEESEILARLQRGERIDHYETIRRRKDGTLINVSLTVSPIRDASGNIIGASKVARDITERKRAEAELKEGHEVLEILNRVGRMLSSELDLQKVVQTLTDAATAVTGAAFGSFFYNVIDERGSSYMLYTLSGASRDHFAHFPMPRATDLFGPTFRGEGVIRIDDVKHDPRYGKNSPYFGMPAGHLPVTSYLAVPVVSHSGEVLGGLFFGHPSRGVFTDRHERIVTGLAGQAASAMDNARLYEEMRRAHTEAETANRLKDEFLATVSHELRTPLNAILGWARLLNGGQLDEDSRGRAVETIERSALAQGQIVEDILDVSRIITGKLRLDVAPVEIGQLVSDAVQSMQPTADARGVRLQTILDTRTNLIWGDSQRLQQVIWNLLSNAIKFTSKGGRVQVALARVNSQIEISVSDTGKGIKREFLPHVFERFTQADSSTTRMHGGLGLGLAIVRHLTELHGGTVAADSGGEGLGATFTITLPVAVLREGNWLNEESLHQDAPRAVEGRKTSVDELRDVHVLVVDDEPDACELLKLALQHSGAEVRVSNTVREALAIMKEWKPDVLLSDIGMPGEDGYELIRQVRALPHKEGGSIPAAALTAYATSQDRLKVLTAGFQTHIAKPVEPQELTAVVAILSGKKGTASDK
jgi:PAS domain S-box-containing protein